jgi:hypothetical protein
MVLRCSSAFIPTSASNACGAQTDGKPRQACWLLANAYAEEDASDGRVTLRSVSPLTDMDMDRHPNAGTKE